MPYCDDCGAHVSESFHRVFSNPDGGLYGCVNCGATTAGARRAKKDVPSDSTS